MRVTEPWRIGAAGAALAVALAGVVGWEGQARASGREVALPMEVLDPEALSTGRYVGMELGERLPAGASCPPGTERQAPAGPFDTRSPAWVALVQEGPGWRVAGQAYKRGDAARLGAVVVRGSADCRRVGGGALELDIGISRFHAGRREARALQQALASSHPGGPRAYALVSVGRDGRARLNGVAVNGRRIELDWF